LEQGDYKKVTVYSKDPVEVAQRWESLGAKRLHVVDLDGAKTGIPANLDIIRQIIQTLKIPVQVGGGIRNLPLIREMIDIGADRVILGTTAVNNPNLVNNICSQFGARIAVALDVKGGKVASEGWLKTSGRDPIALAKEAVKLGVKRFVYTNIKRDGMLSGPDLEGLKELAQATKVPVIASGGISSKEDVEAVKALESFGVEGCIIGKAFYSGAVKPEDVLL
jgi:phosphoribosylformimino-5-aminoimidazole carboxamide ribotide isomerase